MAAVSAAAKTASTLNAAFLYGTHLFEIGGYNDVKAHGRSDGVTSGTFRVAGRDWNVVCSFFNGSLTDISLVLAVAEKNEEDDDDGSVSATVSISIEDPTGGRKPMKIGSRDDEDTVSTFTRSSCSYKVEVPASFHRLEARYVKDDRLLVRCTVRVLVDVEESGPTIRYCFVATPPPPDMTRFLRALLDSGQRADVTFAVERRRFDAHRLVLAMRSPVFRAKFFGDSRDSSLRWFRVHDVSAAVFGAMLHFIYTDELELPPAADGEEAAAAMAQDLLVAADLYGLDRLRLMCESMLWERVRTGGGAGSAISTLALVNGRDGCRQLRDLCTGYVADNWEAAMATEEYRELKTTRPALLGDVLEDVITKQLLHGRRPPTPSPSSGSIAAASTTPPQKSSSVYRPSEVWRGTHKLTVLGHSFVRRTHDIGQFICSGIFEVGGHEWRIVYYPSGFLHGEDEHDGREDEHGGCAAVILQEITPIDPDVVLEAAVVFNVAGGISKSEDDSGNTMAIEFCHSYTRDGPNPFRWLTSTISCPDDVLTVECRLEFQVAAAANKTAPTTAARGRLVAQEQDMVVPPPNIPWHLERLLEDGVGSDVTFSVDGGEVRAHTLVLAQRAPALLPAKGKKNKDKKTMICVDVDGIKAVVFKALLHFVYTDELPPLDDLVRAAGAGKQPSATSRARLAGDLLAAAERYQLVERMRPLCENLLCELISPENAAATLEVARRHGGPELRAYCLDYITSPGVFKAVVASEGYQSLPADALRDIVARVAH